MDGSWFCDVLFGKHLSLVASLSFFLDSVWRIFDTNTQKIDGTQGESVSASVEDKIKICHWLAAFGVDFIEAGWPGSNPKDQALFERLQKSSTSPAIRSKLTAFGSTRRKRMAVQDDGQVQALLDCGAPNICIVAKAHAWQVTDILQTTLEENLQMIHDTVSYLVQAPYHDDDDATADRTSRTVLIDLEHYFDGHSSNPDYAWQCCYTAAKAGASCLVLCDTNGGTMPWQMEAAVQDLRNRLDQHPELPPVTLGIHCHNDVGMAVANSMVAIQAGVGLVQGTINGIGERTGNADLCTIVPNLALKVNSQLNCRTQLSTLTKLSRFVDETLNKTPNAAAPYVGASAFAHKGGLHVAALKKSPDSYQHANPDEVGNASRVLISELSGRQNILGKVQAWMDKGLGSGSSNSNNNDNDTSNLTDQEPEQQDTALMANHRATAILNRVKQLEAKGYTFEGAEASVDLMILHASQDYCPPFQVLDYSAQVFDSRLDSASRFLQDDDDEECCSTSMGLGPTARATVKVRTIETRHFVHDHDDMEEEDDGGRLFECSDDNHDDDDIDETSVIHERLEVADGNGPVDALAQALMRALQPVHPSLVHVELMDYKVRILDPESATGAAARVLIEFRNVANETTWTTVSVDTNVISASVNALIDGLEYALLDYAHDNCLLLPQEPTRGDTTVAP